MEHQQLQWHILEDATAVAQAACQRILNAAQQAIAKQGFFRCVLAGGSTPEKTYQLLKETSADWQRWHIYYGDERCLPVESKERNSVMASQAWLQHVPIPPEQIHPIPVELGTVDAARHYAETIARAIPFDMVLLGMGEDGHTASLFPHHIHSTEELVHAVFDAPKPPAQRVSLSVQALTNTTELLFIITGAGKRAAVSAWRRDEPLPVTTLSQLTNTVVLLDWEAAGTTQ